MLSRLAIQSIGNKKIVFGYPAGILFSQQQAQHTDIIHTMHTMHKGQTKSSGLEYVIILIGYKVSCMVRYLLWEQEVGGSNPLAPTNYFRHLERILIKPVLFFLFSRRWDRRYSLRSSRLILPKSVI